MAGKHTGTQVVHHYDKTCKYCNQEFKDINSRVFANHVRWCPENKTNGDKGTTKLSRTLSKLHEDKKLLEKGELKIFKVNCYKCNKEYEVEEREKEFPKKEKYFCSSFCSHIKEYSQETRNKISNTLKQQLLSGKQMGFCKMKFDKNNVIVPYKNPCISCGKLILKKDYYCKKCLIKNRISKLEGFKQYKNIALFRFNLALYPDYYDFDLIRKYGWYTINKKGNNINGVSRDHKISIVQGFKLKIDPKLLSHPANCRLIRHIDNITKGSKHLFNLEDLLNDIKKFEEKYGEYKYPDLGVDFKFE